MKKFRIQKPRHLWAMVLFVISLVCIAVGGNQHAMDLAKETFLAPLLYAHIGASIVLSAGTGLFTGLVIWLFAIYLPERKKRMILRNNLSYRYRWFRRALLTIFLFGVEPEDGERIPSRKALDNYLIFREFFSKDDSRHWWSFINWLDHNEHYMQEIVKELELLSQVATHVWHNCDFHDEDVHHFLGELSTMALEYKRTNPFCDDDYKKRFMMFLFGIFSQWNPREGRHETDRIQSMIDKI